MLKSFALAVVFIFTIPLHALECKLIRSFDIRQDDILLRTPYSFCVTHQDEFIVVDGKAGDVKIYDSEGNFVRLLGKKGPGPGEFNQPVFCDYQEPYFAVIDLHKKKVLIYLDEGNGSFRVTDELPCWNGGFDLRIIDKDILISGITVNREEKMYALYLLNRHSRRTRHLVPYSEKFSTFSLSSFWKNSDEMKNAPIIGLFGYCDYADNHSFLVWEGNLRIIKTDIKTGKSTVFGKKTDRYRQPEVSKAMKRAYQARDKAKLTEERHNMSYINGLFAHENYIGLLYGNYSPELNAWRIFLQIYSPDGMLLKEMALPEVLITIPYKPAPTVFFDKSRHTFYYMYHRLDKELEDRYTIAAFRIDK